MGSFLDAAIQPQETIDRYRLEELVGTGGMSQVFRAWDTTLDREVAVKLLHPHLAAKEESRRRLAREARAVARLHHPNILEIYDFSGDQAPKAYIVTEYIRGQTLRRFADEVGFGLPNLGALAGHSLASALEHAHAIGIVHRDVKPENVMVREDGVLKLMDFGIARILDQGERMTMTGTLVGSPAHMAPEIIEGKEADARSDVFSLGTMLYWLCTGALPFSAANTTAVLKRILDGAYEDPRALCPAISDSLCAVLCEALERDPARRLPTARAMRERIEAALLEDGIERPAEELRRFFADPAGRRAEERRRQIERLGIAASAALAAGQRVRALSAVNRLLALEPESALAREILKKVAGRQRVRRVALGVAVASALVGAGLGLSRLPQRARRPETSRAEPLPVAAASRPAPVSTPAALAAAGPHDTAPAKPHALPLSAKRWRTGWGVHELARPLAVSPAPAPAAPPGRLHLFVQPYADVLVDGSRRASGVPTLDLELPAGTHELRLVHPDCEPLERPVTIPAAGEASLRVRLTPKPALLEIRGAPPDAEVMVDGEFRGTVAQSAREPFRVPMGETPARTVTVRVVKPGWAEVVREVPIRANQRVTVDAPLVRR